MGGIAVAQRMDVGGFLDAAGAQGQTEASLQRGAAHRFGGGGRAQAAVAFGREEPARMAVAAPELAQQLEGAVRQRHVTVAVAFARPDVEKHPFGIDIADFQLEGFAQTQAAGVNRAQGHPMATAGTRAITSRTSPAERMTGSLNWGVARANSNSAGQERRRGFCLERFFRDSALWGS